MAQLSQMEAKDYADNIKPEPIAGKKGRACKNTASQRPCLKAGRLVTIAVFGSRGPPARYLTASNTATVTA